MTLPPTLSYSLMCSIPMSPSATPFLHCSVFSPLLLLLHSSFCLLLSLSLNSSLSFRFLPSFSSLPLFPSLSPLLLFFSLLYPYSILCFSFLSLFIGYTHVRFPHPPSVCFKEISGPAPLLIESALKTSRMILVINNKKK